MNHPDQMTELARAHQRDLLRGAVRRRIAAVALCCKPSNIRAALQALTARRSPVPACCA